MKTRIKITFTTLTLIFSLLAVSGFSQQQQQEKRIYIKIDVDGLSCPFCAYGIEKYLKDIEGAKDVFISVEDSYTTFNVPGNKKPTEKELKKVVDNAGFTARKVSYSDKPFSKKNED